MPKFKVIREVVLIVEADSDKEVKKITDKWEGEWRVNWFLPNVELVWDGKSRLVSIKENE